MKNIKARSKAMHKLVISLLLAGTALSGCVSVLPEAQTPAALIRLPTTGARAAATPLAADVVVHRPDSMGAFAGVEIASADGQRIKYIKDVQWADSPSHMLQEAVVDSLLASKGEGRAASVQTGARGLYIVRWSIRDLTVNNGASEARCAVRVTLTRMRGRTIIASSDIWATEPMSGSTSVDRAEALARAMMKAAELTADFVSANAEAYDYSEERRVLRDERFEERERKMKRPPSENADPPPPEEGGEEEVPLDGVSQL